MGSRTEREISGPPLRPSRSPLPLARAVYCLSVAANELPMLVLLLLTVTVSASLLTSGVEDSDGPVSALVRTVLGVLLLIDLVVLQRRRPFSPPRASARSWTGSSTSSPRSSSTIPPVPRLDAEPAHP